MENGPLLTSARAAPAFSSKPIDDARADVGPTSDWPHPPAARDGFGLELLGT